MSQPKMKVDSNGTKLWFLNGQYHREGGPAIEWASGSKWWCINGQYHREGGPAIEYSNGEKYWYLNDQQYSPEDYIIELERLGLKDSIVNTLFNIG